MIAARIKTVKMGRMTFYQPELKLGWWVFKHWAAFYANSRKGDLHLYISNNLYAEYDEAMKQFDEYSVLTNKDYRMTHVKPIGA